MPKQILFYPSTSEGFGHRVCCAPGVTIVKCQNETQAIQLAQALNRTVDEVMTPAETRPVAKLDIRSGEDAARVAGVYIADYPEGD